MPPSAARRNGPRALVKQPVGARLGTMDEGEQPTTGPDGDAEEELVLAMPRRELYSIQGFTTQVEMRVIETLADESWYALPSVLREDIDAKEVRIGLVVQRRPDDPQVLLSEDGILLHTTTVPPEVSGLGEGLAALRAFARAACSELFQARPEGVQLYGYLNQDALPEIRPLFILTYLAQVPAATPAPMGMSWVARDRIHNLPVDAASSALTEQWRPDARAADDG